jgi:biopolymer transport protein ExbD
MRHAAGIRFLVAALVMALAFMHGAVSETAIRDIRVTLRADGEHCVVRAVTILCSDLAAHLRDTLKLPQETTIHLRAERAASYRSGRTVLDVIQKSGFKHPVAYLTEPSEDK